MVITRQVPNAPRPQVPPSSFYEVAGERLEGDPGTLIDRLELEAPPGIRGWAVLYRSTGIEGQPIGVSGLVLAPDGAPPARPRPILAWAHGTTGIADQCAPSRAGLAGIGLAELLGLVFQGFVLAATDYEGLGTAGIHPYLVGLSEGRSIIDSIRAADAIPEAGVGPRAAVLGISQGAHATLWAAEVGPAYAPEIDLVGVVAASPPIDLHVVQHAVLGGPPTSDVSWLEALLVVRAWRDVYGAPTEHLISAEGQAIVERLDQICPWDLPVPLSNPILKLDIPEWLVLLEANSPGHAASTAPILAVAARADEQVPASTIGAGIERLRRAGSGVELRWVDGDHASTLTDPASAAAALAWIGERFADGR